MQNSQTSRPIHLAPRASRLAAERAAAIDGLFTAMKNHYSSVEPPLVRALAEEIAALFKRAEDLKKLGADVATLFPGEGGALSWTSICICFEIDALTHPHPPSPLPDSSSSAVTSTYLDLDYN